MFLVKKLACLQCHKKAARLSQPLVRNLFH